MAAGGYGEGSSFYSGSPIDEWTAEECYSWALQICCDNCLDPAECNLTVFKRLTGRQMAAMTKQDLEQCVGLFNGTLYHDRLWMLLDHRSSASRGSGILLEQQQYHEDNHDFDPLLGSRSSHIPPNLPLTGMQFIEQGSHGTSFYSSDDSFSSSHHWCPATEPSSVLEPSVGNYSSSFTGYSARVPSLDDYYDENLFAELSLTQDIFPLHSEKSISSPGDDIVEANDNEQLVLAVSDLQQQHDMGEERLVEAGGNLELQPNEGVPATNVPESVINSLHWFKSIPTARDRLRRPMAWEFLLRLLQDPRTNQELVTWVNRDAGVFRIQQRAVVARMWRDHWHREQSTNAVNYESFAKLLRYYYKPNKHGAVILQRVSEQAVYQFGPEIVTMIRQGKRW